jgi:2-succinyl-5-enolpyruvyl-6-hydroxy-3-cyclohexene-1-carboxylate synthase
MVEESCYEDSGALVVNPSTLLARVIVRQIIEAGVTDVVISPGSRNAPLSLAFYQASTKGLIKLHVRIDERTAAFFALGIARHQDDQFPSSAPVVLQLLITTRQFLRLHTQIFHC